MAENRTSPLYLAYSLQTAKLLPKLKQKMPAIDEAPRQTSKTGTCGFIDRSILESLISKIHSNAKSVRNSGCDSNSD
jgi:hypothetical protein